MTAWSVCSCCFLKSWNWRIYQGLRHCKFQVNITFFILILLTHLDNDPMLNIDCLASNGPFHNLCVFQNTMRMFFIVFWNLYLLIFCKCLEHSYRLLPWSLFSICSSVKGNMWCLSWSSSNSILVYCVFQYYICAKLQFTIL